MSLPVSAAAVPAKHWARLLGKLQLSPEQKEAVLHAHRRVLLQLEAILEERRGMAVQLAQAAMPQGETYMQLGRGALQVCCSAACLAAACCAAACRAAACCCCVLRLRAAAACCGCVVRRLQAWHGTCCLPRKSAGGHSCTCNALCCTTPNACMIVSIAQQAL
jgi:hypothetical protein